MNKTTTNPQIGNAIAAMQQNTASPDVVKAAGAGKAYQAVAQSAAIAIQDAANNLRNISTVSTTAIGVALAQYIATGESHHPEVVKQANDAVEAAAKTFKTIGENAAWIARNFPPHDTGSPKGH